MNATQAGAGERRWQGTAQNSGARRKRRFFARSPTTERKPPMSRRYFACMGLLVLIAGVSPGQAPKRAGTAPRTAWGEPDLQGIWDFATITPLERPKELAGKEVLTEEEAAEFERQSLQRLEKD